MLLVALGVSMLAYAAYYSYGYWVGTPTTATVDHCERGGLLPWWSQGDPSVYCNGTWSVGVVRLALYPVATASRL